MSFYLDDKESDQSQYSSSSEEIDLDEQPDSDGNGEDGGESNALVLSERGQNTIEGDFDRLVTSINDVHGITNHGALNRIWETTVHADVEDGGASDDDIDFLDELRKSSGIGKRKGGRRQRRHAQPLLSQQVKSLLGGAVTAHIERELEQEISILQEVIKIEPKHAQAWDMLSEAYVELGDSDGALLFKIMAAHLRHDPELWMELGIKSKERGHLQQALYCYKKACQLDPDNVDALWDRALLAQEINDVRSAKDAFLAILKKFPHDLGVILELQPIIVQVGDIKLGISLFEGAMEYYMQLHPSGHTKDHLGQEMPGGGFGEVAVCTLADFCTANNDFEKAIRVVRTGMRWLQGRLEQRVWDTVSDDREYDIDNTSINRSDGVAVAPGFYPLTINARHRLAVARLKLGDHEEGKVHANIILSKDITEWSVLFREIADTFFEQHLYSEALRVYEKLASDESTSDLEVVMHIGACNRNMGNLKEAVEVYEHLLSSAPDLKDVKIKLAEIYEQMGELRKALDLVYQVIDARRPKAAEKPDELGHAIPGDEKTDSLTLFEEKPKKSRAKPKPKTISRLNAAQLEEAAKLKQTEMEDSWRRLNEAAPGMRARVRDAEAQWLAEAEALTDIFREARELFTVGKVDPNVGGWRHIKKRDAGDVERLEDDLATRLQLELEGNKGRRGKFDAEKDVSWRGVLFDDWLTLFLDYAFLLTRRGQYLLGEELLKHLLYSRPFTDPTSQDTIRLGLIACAIYDQKYDTVTEICRKFINIYQFQSDAFNLLTAVLASGHTQADAFQASPLQKHMSREARLNHAIVNNPDANFGVRNGRFVHGGDKEKDDPDDPVSSQATTRPDAENAVVWTVFSQTFLPAKSYQSATFYAMHAYEVYPHDPVICLTLAITCIGRAMQRQADNRHHMIIQGMTFMHKYKTLRGEAHQEEANYNMGRAFHQLALFTEALQLYEKVLASVENRRKSDPNADLGLARETAYNMSVIYSQTGAIPLVENLYRKWLTV